MEAIEEVPEMAEVLDVLATTSGLRSTMFTRIEGDEWLPCAVSGKPIAGVRAGESRDLRSVWCRFVRDSGQPVVIEDAGRDERVRDDPLHVREGLVSYIGVPVTIGDALIGTLCAMDTQRGAERTDVVPVFELLARLVSHEIELMKDSHSTRAALSWELTVAREREQFLALVAHDLRTPLTGISATAQLILRQAKLEVVVVGARRILDSCARFERMLKNLVDFARGRLGEGIVVTTAEIDDAISILEATVDDAKMIFPTRTVVRSGEHPPVRARWDADRVTQLFENVIVNALEHCQPEEPVVVSTTVAGDRLRVEVTNSGETIDPAVLATLLQPFHASTKTGRAGLGLGFYIADRIARAHGGSLSLDSHDGATRCTIELPIGR